MSVRDNHSQLWPLPFKTHHDHIPFLCSAGDPYYSNQVADTLNSWVVGRAHTPRGLNYYTWAPNKFAASASFLALQAADLGINVQPYRRFAKSQVRLIVA
jgi:hypothetical protein